MAWLLIGLVVGVVALTLIFTSSIEEIWVLGYAAFVMVGAILLSIGVPIYSEKVQTVKESGTVECQECGSQNDANAKYCINCGAKITTERKCAGCGQVLEENTKHCQKCEKKWNNGENVLWRKK